MTARLQERARVLVLSPHCDDETYGMGGTILKLREQGSEVFCLVTVCGELRFEHSGKVVTRAERIAEFEKVKAKLKCDGLVLPFTEETSLDQVPINEVVAAIEEVQDRFNADTWYMIGPSFHQDHRVVFEAAMAAARPTRANCPSQIFRYELPTYSGNPREWTFIPHVYEDIGDHLEEKLEASALYHTQIRPQGMLSLESIRSWAERRGFESRCAAAECFEVIRIIR